MKKAIMLITASLLFNAAFSQPLITKATQYPIEFRLLEKTINGPLFQLKILNAEESEYLINVKDGDQNLLYSGRLKGKNLLQKYMVDVPPMELNDQFKLQVEITSVETRQKQVFKITNKTSKVTDIIVAKL